LVSSSEGGRGNSGSSSGSLPDRPGGAEEFFQRNATLKATRSCIRGNQKSIVDDLEELSQAQREASMINLLNEAEQTIQRKPSEKEKKSKHLKRHLKI